MASETPDWAEKEARCIVGRIAGDVITGWQSEDIRRATSAAKRAEDRIAIALRAARTVPPGYVREDVVAELLREAAQQRAASADGVMEKVRAFIERTAERENPEHYGNARDMLHAVKLEAEEILALLNGAKP